MAEGTIKHNEILEEDIFQNAINSAIAFEKHLDKIEKGIVLLSKESQHFFKNAVTPTEIKQIQDLQKQIDLLQKQVDAFNKVQAERKINTDKLTKAQESLQFAQSKEAKQLADLKVKTEALNKANKEEAKAINSIITPYQKLAKEYSENVKLVKDILASKGKLTEADKKLIATTKAQSDELKKIDATVGQHNRNVGNYTEGITAAFKENGLFTESLGKMGTVGQVGIQVFGNFASTIKNIGIKFDESGKKINRFNGIMKKSIIGAIILILASVKEFISSTEEGEAKFSAVMNSIMSGAKLTFSTILASLVGLKNMLKGDVQVGLVQIIAAIDNYINKIGGVVKESYNLTIASRELEHSLMTLNEQLAKVVMNIDDELAKANDETISYDKRGKALTKYQNLRIEEAKINNDIAEKELAIVKRDIKSKMDEHMGQEVSLELQKKLSDANIKYMETQDAMNDVTEDNARARRELINKEMDQELDLLASKKTSSTAQHDIILEQLKDEKIQLDDRRAKAKQLSQLSLAGFHEYVDIIEKRQGVKINEDKLLAIIDKSQLQRTILNLDLNTESVEKLAFIIKKTQNEQIEAQKELTKIENEETQRRFKISSIEFQMKMEDEKMKLEAINTLREKNNNEEKKINDGLVEDTIDNRNKIFENKKFLLEKEFAIGMNQISSQEEEDIRNAKNTITDKKLLAFEIQKIEQKSTNDKIKLTNKKNKDVEDLEYSHNLKIKQILDKTTEEAKEREEKNKQLRDKEIEEEGETINAIIDGWKEGLSKKNSLKEKALDQELSMNETNIQTQQNLAARGLDNQLGYETAQKAKIQQQQKNLKKKEQEEEQAMELAKLFISLEIAYAKDKKKGLQAAALAMKDTLIAKGMAKVIAGFYKGTDKLKEEDAIKIPGRQKDNLLIAAHQDEIIMGVDDSRKLQKMGFGRKEIMQSAIATKQGSLPVIYDNNKKDEINNMIGIIVSKKMDEIIKTIKNKPETSINVDNLGSLITERIENGLIQKTNKKRWI